MPKIFQPGFCVILWYCVVHSIAAKFGIFTFLFALLSDNQLWRFWKYAGWKGVLVHEWAELISCKACSLSTLPCMGFQWRRRVDFFFVPMEWHRFGKHFCSFLNSNANKTTLCYFFRLFISKCTHSQTVWDIEREHFMCLTKYKRASAWFWNVFRFRRILHGTLSDTVVGVHPEFDLILYLINF